VEKLALLNQGMNDYHNDFLSPPKSPNTGGLSINYSPQSWGARGAKTYLKLAMQKNV
jgi:hypothetical protein